MLKALKKFEKNSTKLGNPYYLVLFENRTKPGTVLSETVLSGDSLYLVHYSTSIEKVSLQDESYWSCSIFKNLDNLIKKSEIQSKESFEKEILGISTM